MWLSPSADNAFRSILKFFIVIALIVGSFFVATHFAKEPYTMDTSNFESVILCNEEISLDGITFTNNRLFGLVTENATDDMIVKSETTSSAGTKTLIIEYKGREYTLVFEVKYKVDFVSNGKLLSSQIVSSVSELQPPEVITEKGFEFVGWDYDLNTELTDNTVINAVFEEVDYPALTEINATYGDTLGQITLPSNSLGHWEFIMPADTPVGDAGKNQFSVRFVFADGSIVKTSSVRINVAKVHLDFSDVVDVFTYDGNEHFPTYSLPLDVEVIQYGYPNVNAGEYEYSLEINDKNYEGSYSGVYKIEKPTVTVTLSSATIVYGETIPEFSYTVEGFDNVDLLGITLNVPELVSQVGVIDITANIANTNVIANVINGTLTVEKAEMTVEPPTVGSVTFGDPLSSVEFTGSYLGKWRWKDGSIIVDSLDGISAIAVFTPNNANYEEYEVEVRVTEVNKRQLIISVTKSVFTYAPGVSHSLEYIICDSVHTDLIYTDLNVTGSFDATDVGSYPVTLSIVDDRYWGNISVNLEIVKADPDVSFDFIAEGVWKPGISLSEITLPIGYEWKEPMTVISGAGEGRYDVIFTPSDTDNYNVEEGTVTVRLDKANGIILGLSNSYTFTFDGTAHTFTGSANHGEASLIYKCNKGNRPADEIKDAGVYTLTVTLPESANYKAAAIIVTITVNKADNTDTVDTEQSATYLDKLTTLTLPTSDIGTWSWKGMGANATVGNAGTNTFTALFTPTNPNYNSREVTVTVTVAKKTVTQIPTLNATTFVYTGSTIAPTVTGADTTLYTVTNNGATNVGSHNVTLTLLDPDNYKWSDVTGAVKNIGYTITKATAEITDLTIEGWTYNEAAKAPSANTTFGTVNYLYSSSYSGAYTAAVPTAAGTYYVKAVVANDENGNYDGDETEPVSFVIAKATVTQIPTLDATEFVYTGSNIAPTLTGADTTLYSVTNNGGVSVGSYNVTLTLLDPDNYEWSDVTGAVKNIGYTITKATAAVEIPTLDGWTFGEVSSTPTAETTFGSVSYVYSTSINGVYTSVKPTAAGTYFVKAVVADDESGNFDGAESEPVSFTIAKADAFITGLYESYSFTYKNEAYVITGIGRSHNESALVYKVDGVEVGAISVTNAGVYSVTVILPESDNYNEATATAIITVDKADNTDTVDTEQSATYLDKLTTLTLPTSDIGTWTWKDMGADATVGNAGTNTFTALFTPTNPNYNSREVTVTVTVAKKTVTTIPTLNATTFVYTGSNIAPTVTGADTTLYTVTNNGATNVGSHNVTLTLLDPDNYKWSDVTGAVKNIGYTITKATTVMSGLTIGNWTYGTTPSAPSATANFGTVVYKYSKEYSTGYTTTVPTNAGNYYVKAEVAEGSNWTAASTDPVSFKIEKADPVMSYTPTTPSLGGQYYMNLLNFEGDTSVTYNGSAVSGTIGNISVTFAGTSSTYSITFTPDTASSVNFNSKTLTGTINLKTVATIGLKGTAYGTIEAALAAAVSGNTVWVVTDNTGNVVIKENVTVPSGVTLLIPYGDADSTAGRNKSDKSTIYYVSDDSSTPDVNEAEEHGVPNDFAYKYSDEYRKTLVILASGKKLTVEGTLEISGEMSGGAGGCKGSLTAGMYATLHLESGATVEIKGTAKLYGFIEEAEVNGGGQVTVAGGGELYMPLTLHDFKGGSLMKAIQAGMSTYKYSPFNQFTMANVEPLMRIEYGASVIGYCNLYASSQHNSTTSKLIGTGGLVELTDATYSYIEAKYDRTTGVTDLRIYGGAKNNSMSLKVVSVTVNSSDYVFALSWCYNITLAPNSNQTTVAEFSMPYSYKLLPGGSLTVEAGARLTVGSMIVYDTFVDTIHAGKYPTVGAGGAALAPGKLLVRGSVYATTLAGKVYADKAGGTVRVSKSDTMSTYEPTVMTGSILSSEITEHQVITQKLVLVYGASEKSSVYIGAVYTSYSDTKEWRVNIDLTEFVEIPLTGGYHVSTNAALLYDQNGNAYVGTYDSRVSGTRSSISVIKDNFITYYLNKNQLVGITGSSSYAVESNHPILKGTDYELVWTVVSDKIPTVYHVPTFSFSFVGDVTPTYTVTYKGLNGANVLGNSQAYAEIYLDTTYSKNNYKITLTVSITGIDSANVSGSLSAEASDSATVSNTITVYEADNGKTITVTVTKTEEQESSGGCVTPDSMITLADGTQVRVDSLKGDEMLLVWNLETGKLDFAPIMFVDSEAAEEVAVVYLYFSDGTVVKVIYEHGFWNYDLNRYVYLDENASDYIGHFFAKQNGDGLVKVQLTDVEIRYEISSAWSPVTVGHLCYFVNGMLTMPGGADGMFNIFEVDAETMTYDLEAMERDIEKYGLFTYEELNAICQLPEEMFYAAGGAYLKISLGKGNLTMEQLIYMIERYRVYI